MIPYADLYEATFYHQRLTKTRLKRIRHIIMLPIINFVILNTLNQINNPENRFRI